MDCEQTHDIVYVPLLRSDLKRLWSFLFTPDPALLTETLKDTLRAYNKI